MATINGGSGDDTLTGTTGNDAIYGGSGSDTINASGGNDVVTAQSGADTVEGGAGNDSIQGGQGNDALYGGDGADQILGDGQWYAPSAHASGSGNNATNLTIINSADGPINLWWIDASGVLQFYGTIQPGETFIQPTFDDHNWMLRDEDGYFLELIEGSANQTVDYGSEGLNDSIDGGAGDDEILGMYGDDTIDGGTGLDSIAGGYGNDTIYGGDDNDIIDGGAGNDTLDGGAGADTLTGGAGADTFIVDNGGDIITDFDTTNADDGDSTNNDFVDLSAFYNATTLAAWNAANPDNTFVNPLAWMRADQSDGTLNEAGGLQVQDGGTAVAASTLNTENTGVVCFTQGTLIKTQRGDVPVEALAPGDFVYTMDNGLQPIRWVGARYLSALDLANRPNLRPIRIPAAVSGLKKVTRDLIVSPQHRVLIASKVALRMFGTTEVLVAARQLIGMHGVVELTDLDGVTYYHILLDQHEIIFANGVPAESLYLGAQALNSLTPAGREEIATLFPEVLSEGFVAPQCRPFISGKPARQIAYRHSKNGKPLCDTGALRPTFLVQYHQLAADRTCAFNTAA